MAQVGVGCGHSLRQHLQTVLKTCVGLRRERAKRAEGMEETISQEAHSDSPCRSSSTLDCAPSLLEHCIDPLPPHLFSTCVRALMVSCSIRTRISAASMSDVSGVFMLGKFS